MVERGVREKERGLKVVREDRGKLCRERERKRERERERERERDR